MPRRRIARGVVIALLLANQATAQAQVVPGAPTRPALASRAIVLPQGITAPPMGRGPAYPTSMARITTTPAPVAVPNCPTPSLVTCQTEGYLASYCGIVKHRATCRSLIEAAMVEEMAKLPLQAGQHSMVGIRPVRGLPQDFADFEARGLEHFAAGDQQKQSLSLKQFLWALVVLSFEQNGNQVTHCQEYVREKFYGLSHLQDQALGGTDARAYFDLTTQQLPATSMRSRDEGSQFTISWPRNTPKNRYGIGTSTWYPPNITVGIRHQRNPVIWAWQTSASQVVPIKDLAWHRARAAATAGYSDDDLRLYHNRQKQFVSLVLQREALKTDYEDAMRRRPPAPMEAKNSADPGAFDRQFRDNYARKFSSLDALIETAIVQGKVDGCLEAGVTPCDWSPEYFKEEFEAMVVQLKQPALRECQTFIGSAFDDTDPVARSNVAGCNGDCRGGTTKLDAYLERQRSAAIALRPTGGADPKVAQESGDDSSLGNGKFKAGFDFSSGWSTSGFIAPGSRPCDANFGLHGDFSAYVKLFGKRADVASLHGEIISGAATTRARASLRVLGQDLFTPVDERAGTSYQVVKEPSWDAEFGAAMGMVIIAIPVKIEAGLAGSTGAQFGLGAGAVRRDCAAPNSYALLSADAFVRPHASLDAFASASVDLAIAEVGVRGELTLVSAAVPFRLNLALSQDAHAVSQLSVNSRMAVDLSTLDGRVFLFAEALGEEARLNLIKWSGIHTTVALFEMPAVTIPLATLRGG